MRKNIHPTAVLRDCTVAKTAEVREYCSLLDSHLAEDVVLLERVTFRHVTVAKGAFVNAGSVVENTTIEEDVQIAPNCSVMGVWHDFDEKSVSHEDVFTRITLKKNCLLGTGVIVTPGVTIGEGAVIGAGTVVTKDVPAHYLCYGTPPNQTRISIAKYRKKKTK